MNPEAKVYLAVARWNERERKRAVNMNRPEDAKRHWRQAQRCRGNAIVALANEVDVAEAA